MNVYTIISMTYIQLIQPLSKQSGVAESIGIITEFSMYHRGDSSEQKLGRYVNMLLYF